MNIRERFPFFNNNTTTIYLDSAATTQKPLSVIEAINQFYLFQNSNTHRSNSKIASNITTKYEEVRSNVCQFINANSPNDIVWTKGTTDGINLVAHAWGEQNIEKDDTILVLGSEHHANFVPWQQLALRKNANFSVVKIKSDGMPDIEHYKELLKLKPKLVTLQHCSNALGNIHPINELVELAKKSGATTLVDGAQAIAHHKVNVSSINCDMYVFSAHKMYGPLGLGVLYIHERVKSHFKPYQFGGEMIEKVSIDQTYFRPIPAMLETGTQNISAIIGLNSSIRFINSTDYREALTHKQKLYKYLLQKLSEIEVITIIGNSANNIGIASFVVEGETISDISTLLSEQNIAIRSGHHCAMPLMASLAIDGTHRVSLGVYNNTNDVDTFIQALNKSIALLN